MAAVIQSQSRSVLVIIKNNAQDIVLVSTVVLIGLLANLPENFLFGVDRTYLLGTLTGIIAVALIKHLKLALMLLVFAIIVGANMPEVLAKTLHIEPWVLTVTLAIMVIISSVNKFYNVPKWLDPNEESETLASHLHGAKAMFSAIGRKRISSVRALLRQGIDPDIRAVNGETPLMYATSINADFIVQMLLDAGADYTLTNNDGYTSLKVAEIKGYDLVATLLQHAGAES